MKFLNKTALYERHKQLDAKMVEFAGYSMPLQYEGIVKEHMAVRESVGKFDVSHMGEFIVSGENASKALEKIMTNSIFDMLHGQVRYSLMCDTAGKVIDDLLIYKKADDNFMLVVNASNRHKDLAWLQQNLSCDAINITDISDETSLIALQGPQAESVLSKLTIIPDKYYTFIETKLGLISRTGYTGEDGFELYIPNEFAEDVWDMLEAKPCGLGARDTLRLEAAMPLYGHELGDINPIEAGLKMFVKFGKEFIGKNALLEPVTRIRRGIVLNDKCIARQGSKIFSGNEIGFVTSGSFCPFVNRSIALVMIDKEYIDKPLQVEVRGKLIDCEIVKLPFHKNLV